jgi:hypothetical protein
MEEKQYETLSVTTATKQKLKAIKDWEEIDTYDELMLGFIELYKESKSKKDKPDAS